MRLFNMQRKDYSVDVWGFELIDSPGNDPQPLYTMRETIKVGLASNLEVPTLKLYTDESIQLNYRLYNIRDRHGNQLMPEGTFYLVTSVAPRLNVFSEAEGYVITAPLSFLGG